MYSEEARKAQLLGRANADWATPQIPPEHRGRSLLVCLSELRRDYPPRLSHRLSFPLPRTHKVVMFLAPFTLYISGARDISSKQVAFTLLADSDTIYHLCTVHAIQIESVRPP